MRSDKNKRFRSLKKWKYKEISKEIAGYGYEYSLKKYMVHSGLLLTAVVLVSIFFSLELVNIVIVSIAALIAFPLILLSQFKYANNNARFENIVNYMDQMIISFKHTPKILLSLENTLDLVDGEMKKCVVKAIDVIQKDTQSTNVYEKAFSIMEKEFKCSRLSTLHRFLINVEKQNSVNYRESLDVLYFDVRAWVTRVYQYQAELKNVKSKIVLILGISIGIAGIFTMLLGKCEAQLQNSVSAEILGHPAYQISTTIFFIIYIVIYTFLSGKVTGNWLVNDVDNQKENLICKYIDKIDRYEKGKTKTKPFNYGKKKKAVERELVKEFPVWLRDVAVTLNNMVVVQAISNSLNYSSKIMKKFLINFMDEVEKNPNSIKPYTNFLGVYNAKELQTAFKTLYSIRTMGVEESQKQVNDLISRNQQLLETAERMRNEHSIAYISFISMVPMVILSFKLIVDLGLMLVMFLSMSKGVF